MTKIIDLTEWKRKKQEKEMWKKLKSEGYDVTILEELWENGDIFFATTSAQPVETTIEFTPASGTDEKNFTLE